jgi:PPP family 3-phenylpropionic acid transporter
VTTIFALPAFWFLYMSGVGMFFPFYALYLAENARLTGTEIGIVYAMIPLASLLAPSLWGRLADKRGERPRILAVVLAGTGAGCALLGLVDGFLPLLAGTALFSAFATAVIPLGISVSLSALGPDGHERFGTVRVWGTVGYLLFVLGFPWVLDGYQAIVGFERLPDGPSEPGLELMFFLAAVLSFGAALATRRIAEREEITAIGDRPHWSALFRHGPFVRILGFVFLGYVFLQGPMNFFPAYVRSRGGGLDTVSAMWIVMLLPEVPLVALSGPGFRRLGARPLLAIGVAAGGLRWLVCAASDSMPIIYAVQALHGVVVAGLLIGGPLYVDAAVPLRLRATAQGLLAMAGVGIGGVTSSVVTGLLLDRFGVTAPFVASGVGAVLLGAATMILLPKPTRP